MANVSTPVRIVRWIAVSHVHVEAIVDHDGKRMVLVAEGPVASYVGGCKAGDVLAVRGVRVGDQLLCEAAELVLCSVLAPGWTPCVIGYKEPPAGMRRAA